MLGKYEGQLADMLFDVGAVKFGEFRLKLHEKNPDAPLSPIYLNLRTPDNKDGALTPEILELIANLMMERLPGAFRFVVGIPQAGEPIAEVLVTRLEQEPHVWSDLQLLHLGKEETPEDRRITGVQEDLWTSDGDVLLVDDLITQADTKLEAIQAVRDSGLTVYGLIVLVDREQGGMEHLMQAGHRAFAVLNLSDLLAHYVETGKIDQVKADEVRDYVAASRG